MEVRTVTEDGGKTVGLEGSRVGEGAADTEQETCDRQNGDREHKAPSDSLEYPEKIILHAIFTLSVCISLENSITA